MKKIMPGLGVPQADRGTGVNLEDGCRVRDLTHHAA